MGNWSAALHGAHICCPHCGEWRLIEQIVGGWLCNVCAKTFRETH
jgi:uncharacterized protein (DUF983 family)